MRVTGLRIRGPNSKRYLEHHRRRSAGAAAGTPTTTSFPLKTASRRAHPRLEVDNCEISGFGHSGISLGRARVIHSPQLHPSLPVQRTGLRRLARLGVVADRVQPIRLESALHRGNGPPRLRLRGKAQRGVGHVAEPLLRHARRAGSQGRHQHSRHYHRHLSQHVPRPQTPVVIRGQPRRSATCTATGSRGTRRRQKPSGLPRKPTCLTTPTVRSQRPPSDSTCRSDCQLADSRLAESCFVKRSEGRVRPSFHPAAGVRAR